MGAQNKLGEGGRFFLNLINEGVKISGEGGWIFKKSINFGNE